MRAIRLCPAVLLLLLFPVTDHPAQNYYEYEKEYIAKKIEEPLRDALQCDPKQFVLYYLPAYLEKLGPDEYRRQVFDVAESTEQGYPLMRCFAALNVSGCDYRQIPKPHEAAFREFCNWSLFAHGSYEQFFGNWKMINWHQAMRAAIRQTLQQATPEWKRISWAIQLVPVFFTEQELGEWFAFDAVGLSLDATRKWGWDVIPTNGSCRQRCAIRHWIDVYWQNNNDQRRLELARMLAGNYDNYENYYPYYKRHAYVDRVPFYDWLKEHPAELRQLLGDSKRCVRQETLYHSMALNPPLLSFEDPLVTAALIDGLQNDNSSWNHRACYKLLAEHPQETLPAMRAAFPQSTDGQQKSMLCDLLVCLGDEPSRAQLQEYLFGLLATMDWQERRKIFAPFKGNFMELILYCQGWTARRLYWLGEPAAQYLGAQLNKTGDPQQAGLCVNILNRMGRADLIEWRPELVRTLAAGLEDNNVQFDMGICTAALKLTPKELTGTLFDYAYAKDDAQLRMCFQILNEFITGDRNFYRILALDATAKHPYDKNRYWECDYDFWAKPAEQRGGPEFTEYFKTMLEIAERRI